jgi:hypothetical protein
MRARGLAVNIQLVQQHPPFAGSQGACQRFQKRGFAGTVRAEKYSELSGRQMKIDVIKDHGFAVVDTEALAL